MASSILELTKNGLVSWEKKQRIPLPYKLSTFQMYNAINRTNYHVLKKKKDVYTTIGVKELPIGAIILLIDLNNYSEIPDKYLDAFLDSKAKKQIKAIRKLQESLESTEEQSADGTYKESESSEEESSASEETESEKLRLMESQKRAKELETQRNKECNRAAEKRHLQEETLKSETKKQRLLEDEERERQRLEEEQRLREQENERLHQELLTQVQMREKEQAVQSITEQPQSIVGQPVLFFDQLLSLDNNSGCTQEDANQFENYQDYYTNIAKELLENQKKQSGNQNKPSDKSMDFVDAENNVYHFHFHYAK